MRINRFKDFITENSDLAPGSVGIKKFKVKGYRTWDEARPEGVIEADSHQDILSNYDSYAEVLIQQDPAFEGADLDTVEEIPNNI